MDRIKKKWGERRVWEYKRRLRRGQHKDVENNTRTEQAQAGKLLRKKEKEKAALGGQRGSQELLLKN